jgi:hypothetical protein
MLFTSGSRTFPAGVYGRLVHKILVASVRNVAAGQFGFFGAMGMSYAGHYSVSKSGNTTDVTIKFIPAALSPSDWWRRAWVPTLPAGISSAAPSGAAHLRSAAVGDGR